MRKNLLWLLEYKEDLGMEYNFSIDQRVFDKFE